MSSSFVLHITDCHLYEDKEAVKNRIRPFYSLKAVVDAALSQQAADAVIVSGDVAHEPTSETYSHLKNILSVATTSNVLVLPGNHDVEAPFRKHFEREFVELDEWNIFAIDTHVDGKLEGYVASSTIDQLFQRVTETTASVLVTGHHPIANVEVNWLDAHQVSNPDIIRKLLTQDSKIKAYVCGHVHMETDRTIDGLRQISTPSTCWQFAKQREGFAFDTALPGWRWFELGQDGSLYTQTYRLKSKQPEWYVHADA